jgi:replicative DNA helicase
MDFKEKRKFESEQRLLGILLNDGSLLDEVKLSHKHFSRLEHQQLFKGLHELKDSGKEVDIFYLEDLGESRINSMGGMAYIRQLFSDSPPGGTLKRYEKNIKEYITIKAAEQHAKDFLEQVKETNDLTLLSTLIDNVNKLESETVEQKLTFKDHLHKRVLEHAESKAEGLSGINTGYQALNSLTDGWQKTDLIIVGARPSMGKTAFLLNSILEGSKKDNVFTTFFSIEMAEGAVIDRMIATEGKISVYKMRNINKYFRDRDPEKYSQALGFVGKLGMDIRKENTVAEMRSVVRRNMLENPGKKHLVAIDFLTMMRATEKTENRVQEIEGIVLDLKKMANDFELPIIVLSQLSRQLEQRADKRPMMSDLRESGAIEQTADMVMFLYRDSYYNTQNPQEPNTREDVEFLVQKNRNGPVGMVKLGFYKEINKFYD